MVKQTRVSGAPVRGIIAPRQFCAACICLLGTMLCVQVCVLISLLRRLAEVHRAGTFQSDVAVAPLSPSAAIAASALSTASNKAQTVQVVAETPRLRQGRQSPTVSEPATVAKPVQKQDVAAGTRGVSPPAEGSAALNPVRKYRGLSIGVACGIGIDAVLLYLASLTRVSDCHVVLFVDSSSLNAVLVQEGIPSDRVTLEVVSLPLAQPWERCHLDTSRFRLYQSYLERTGAASQYDYLQISHVEDVAFQSDPFAWASKQPPGLQIFSDEPSHIIANDQALKQLLQQAYGSEAFVSNMLPEVSYPVGYVIGTAGDVQRYVDELAKEIQKRPICQKKGADQALHDVLTRRWLQEGAANSVRSGHVIHAHAWERSPVWTGGHVQRGAYAINGEKNVVNRYSQPYFALHQYDEHDDLWKVLAERFLKTRLQERLQVREREHCQQYDVASGDMRGFDLSHTPADTQEDCCAACNRETSCGAFIFSLSRKHCWLKLSGGLRIPAHQGEDLQMGLRKTR